MSIFSTTTKAYWRDNPEPHDCTRCKAAGQRTQQPGHKPRRAKEVHWWSDTHLCDACFDDLPHTPPLP